MGNDREQDDLALSVRRFNSALTAGVKSVLTAIHNATVAVWVVGVALVLVVYGWESLKERRFDRQKWSTATDIEKGYMASDLVERVLPGKTETQIGALLGPPMGPEAGDDSGSVSWWAGQETGPLALDFRCIVVNFRASGVATEETISMRDCG